MPRARSLAQLALAAAVACAALAPTPADATDPPRPPACPTPDGSDPALARHDAEARLAFIRARLEHDAWRSRQWSLAFGTSYAVLTGASAAVAPLIRDRASVPDIYVGGFSAIIGFGLIAVSPLKVIADREALEASIRNDPHQGRCAVLARAEAMLVADAKNEKFGRGWLIHSGNVLIGVGALLVLGLGYGRWGSGVANGLGSIAVGELMILTQPHGLIRDLKNYRLGDLREPQRRRRRASLMASPTLLGSGYGVALVGRF